MAKKNTWISNKISRIMKEGVRKNTRKALSKTNRRRKVSQKQAVAIAQSIYKRRKK